MLPRTLVWLALMVLASVLGSCASEKTRPEPCDTFPHQCTSGEECPGGSVCGPYPHDGCWYCFAAADAAIDASGDASATDASDR
jgi:Fe-S-cluster containining protein